MSHSLITLANDPVGVEEVRRLLRAYAAEVEAPACFETLESELEALPGVFAPPGGALLLATEGGVAVGCVALEGVDGETCRMRRLFVDPRHRGGGLGRDLVEAALSRARRLGYRRLEIETVPASMRVADAIYARLGFVETGRGPGGVVRRALDLTARP